MRKKQPVIGLHRKLDGEIVPHRIGRHDVEHAEAGHAARMIQGHAIANAAAPVMTYHGKAVMPELLHQMQEVVRHGALGIGEVIGAVQRAGRVSITPKIGHHAGEALHKIRRDPVPHGMGLRKSMNEEQGRAMAADAGKDIGVADAQPMFAGGGEQLVHGGRLHPGGELRQVLGNCSCWRHPGRAAMLITCLLPARWRASRCRGGRNPPANRYGRPRHRPGACASRTVLPMRRDVQHPPAIGDEFCHLSGRCRHGRSRRPPWLPAPSRPRMAVPLTTSPG